ncbi:MAG TPA: M1 family aminopeptidase [Candidatus Acidoferrum sp.]|nr:M1 family aminopeptidase [Candidatus Acidoferrum sp.]
MTKVLLRARGLWIVAASLLFFCALQRASAEGQNSVGKAAETLYLQLGQVELDPTRVYQVRGASLDRSAVHITLEDGTIAFTQDVMGKVTGAFFEGDGEVLLVPPTDVERRSMSLFTGMAILEEHFATAYFRFNDDVPETLRPDLRATDNKEEFVNGWKSTARNLAQSDAMRLLQSFSQLLPVRGAQSSPTIDMADRFLHARLQGTKLGVFDVYFDSLAREQVQAGQARNAENGVAYYDVWTSFSPSTSPEGAAGNSPKLDAHAREDWVTIRNFVITTDVEPPRRIHAHAMLRLEIRSAESRVIFFELSRALTVESVKLAGQPVEFIHNPAVEGTQLARRGNDIMAVILPEQPVAGQTFELEFVYGGDVLEDAGGAGLLYVGDRGTWYPNRGMAMADFDLEFHYPQSWTLVATGKPTPVSKEPSQASPDMQTSRWVSERPIPFAGFNLGKYTVFKNKAGNVDVETYATKTVERNFPSAPIQPVDPKASEITRRAVPVVVPRRPSPAQNEGVVGEAAARAIRYYAQRFGPYPYSRLSLTQLPGPESQGWPGLVFLSSYAFLDRQEREQLHYEPYRILMEESIPAHETAHQWWGDLVSWDSYRDQWFSEGLSNYCALMMVQEKNPAGFRQIMDKYRRDLVQKNKDGVAPMDAGPVTLGQRLLSSNFPHGYEAISYGRATWLFHMLRSMLKDGAAQPESSQVSGAPDEPFVRALRKVRERYEGKSITTRELMNVFAEELPVSLRYEGKRSLDWFFDGWVNGTSLPTLQLRSVKFTPKGSGSVVSGTIVQKDAPQDLVTSVPVYAVSGKQSVLLGRVFADGEESSFHLDAPAGTHKIVLDPNETVLTAPK